MSNHREIMQTKKENQHVSEENNMLKIKIELLLDMVSLRLQSLDQAARAWPAFFLYMTPGDVLVIQLYTRVNLGDFPAASEHIAK